MKFSNAMAFATSLSVACLGRFTGWSTNAPRTSTCLYKGVPKISTVAAALTELGAVPVGTADRRPIIGAELGVASTQWDTDAGPIDVLVTAAWSNESIVVYGDIERGSIVFDAGRGITMPAAALDDVIRMKEAADRYKDHLALPELRRLRTDRYPELATDEDPFGDFNIEDGVD